MCADVPRYDDPSTGIFLFAVLLAAAFCRPRTPEFKSYLAVLVLVFVLLSVRWWFMFSFTQIVLIDSAALLFLSLQFRRHYRCLTRETGWVKLKPLKTIRRKALLPSFFDAVDAWMNSGRHGPHLPGMHRSPAGSQASRMRQTAAVFVLLLGTLPTLPLHFLPPFDKPSPHQILSFALYFVSAFMTPIGLMLSACCIVSASILGNCYANKVHGQSDERFSEVFEPLTEALRNSPNKDERDAVFRGLVEHDGSLILPPMKTNMAHQAFIGGSGSGKTSYLQMLIESYLQRGDTSIFILDLKADTHELYASARYAARKLRRRHKQGSPEYQPVPIWQFSDRQGFATNLFSLMSQEFWGKLNPLQRTDIQQASMGLSTSRKYGVSWFSDASLAIILFVLEKYPDVRSFSELAKRLDYIRARKPNPLPEQLRKDGQHTSLILNRLVKCESLNPRPHHPKDVLDNAIDMSRFYKEPCVCYAGLSAMLGPITAPEIARVLFSSLLMAGMVMSQQERKMNVVIIGDEIQTMLSSISIMERAMQQARAVGASILLSNQTSADYQSGDDDMSSTIFGNTAIQQWFSVGDQIGIDQLIKFGGKTVDKTMSENLWSWPKRRWLLLFNF